MIRSLVSKVARQFRRPGRPELYYISPGVNWSLDWDGHYITRGVEAQFGLKGHVVPSAGALFGEIVHYGSLWDMAGNANTPQMDRNRVVGTIFHGLRDDPQFTEAFDRVFSSMGKFAKIHTANSIMQKRLLALGVPPEKLVRIPLGVDLSIFKPVTEEQKTALRQELGIPEDAFCIGSFHKDGVGMGEGTDPKLIKGPDVLLDVLGEVHRHSPIFVLLSAPARGYVKSGLDRLGIPYAHVVLDDYLGIPRLYQAIDAYLLTSREEGGPKGVIESLAAGTPLVATKVGMAPDVITSGENGLLAEGEDVDSLANHIYELIDRRDLRERLVFNGFRTIKGYDWSVIAGRYYHEIYEPILQTDNK